MSKKNSSSSSSKKRKETDSDTSSKKRERKNKDRKKKKKKQDKVRSSSSSSDLENRRLVLPQYTPDVPHYMPTSPLYSPTSPQYDPYMTIDLTTIDHEDDKKEDDEYDRFISTINVSLNVTTSSLSGTVANAADAIVTHSNSSNKEEGGGEEREQGNTQWLPQEILLIITDIIGCSNDSIKALLTVNRLNRKSYALWKSLRPVHRRIRFYCCLDYSYKKLLETKQKRYLREVNLLWRAIFVEYLQEKVSIHLDSHFESEMFGCTNKQVIASYHFMCWMNACYSVMLKEFFRVLLPNDPITILLKKMIGATSTGHVAVNDNFKAALTIMNKCLALNDSIVTFVSSVNHDTPYYEFTTTSKTDHTITHLLALRFVDV